MQYFVASELGLQCLHTSQKQVSSLRRVRIVPNMHLRRVRVVLNMHITQIVQFGAWLPGTVLNCSTDLGYKAFMSFHIMRSLAFSNPGLRKLVSTCSHVQSVYSMQIMSLTLTGSYVDFKTLHCTSSDQTVTMARLDWACAGFLMTQYLATELQHNKAANLI